MMLLLELFGLALYLVQQAGILLGVGAELVLLISYLLHLSARSPGPVRFVVPARFVERLGLGLIVLSGLGVVFYHVLRWEVAILLAPAFIAKWVLIGMVLAGYQVEQRAEERAYAWRSVVHGFIGGTWLALFILHMLGPDTSMPFLIEGYAAWMAFFAVVWGGFVTALSPNAMVTKFAARPSSSARMAVTLPNFSLPKISLPNIALPTIPMPALPKIMPPNPTVVIAPAPIAPKAPLPTVYHIELDAPRPIVPIHVEPAPAPRKPIVVAAPAPRPTVRPTPAPSPSDSGLPKIWVMPRNPGQL